LSADCELDRNSELQRFDTDTNEIGRSKAHSDHAGGSARTRSRSDRNVMQRQAPGYYGYRVGEVVVTVVTDREWNAPLDDKFVLNATREEVAFRKRVTD
jgi:hypothetical protein